LQALLTCEKMIDRMKDLSIKSVKYREDSIMEKRKIADCRKYPSENNCTVTISGKEEEVLPLVVYHAVSAHGHKDTPELREQIKSMLKDE
jgi:predicted small metal-binding protein